MKTYKKTHRCFCFLAILLLLGAVACGSGNSNTVTETFIPPQGTAIEVSPFNHEGVDYLVITFPPGTQPDPRTSALALIADKTGEAEGGGFIIQIRANTVVDYVIYPENNSLAIEVTKK